MSRWGHGYLIGLFVTGLALVLLIAAGELAAPGFVERLVWAAGTPVFEVFLMVGPVALVAGPVALLVAVWRSKHRNALAPQGTEQNM